MTNEITRLVRTGVQAAVTSVVLLIARFVLDRTGFEIDTEQVILWAAPVVFGFVMPIVTGAVAWLEKRFPFIGLLNGPRRSVEYKAPEPPL